MHKYSEEFNNAVNKEIDRLVDSAIDDRIDNDKYWKIISKKVQEEIDNLKPFISSKSIGDTLRICLATHLTETNASVYIDIEEIIKNGIKEYPHERDFILERLDILTKEIRSEYT